MTHTKAGSHRSVPQKTTALRYFLGEYSIFDALIDRWLYFSTHFTFGNMFLKGNKQKLSHIQCKSLTLGFRFPTIMLLPTLGIHLLPSSRQTLSPRFMHAPSSVASDPQLLQDVSSALWPWTSAPTWLTWPMSLADGWELPAPSSLLLCPEFLRGPGNSHLK